MKVAVISETVVAVPELVAGIRALVCEDIFG